MTRDKQTSLRNEKQTEPETMSTLLTIEDLCYSVKHRFDKTRVILDHLSFTVHEGDWIGIGGASGSGKTSLLRIIAGEAQCNSGMISFENESFSVENDLTLVEQDSKLVPFLTVIENMLLVALDPERAKELLSLCGISHTADNYPDELSGGELKRADIARSLMTAPKLLLLDEPTANIDKEHAESILDLLDALFANQSENRITIIVVSHSKDVMDRARTKFELRNGRLLELQS